jgi:hypothetical protein
MRIDSYARAIPGSRRIYRIDRWTIPVPGGLPLAASAWFATLAVAAMLLGQTSVLAGVQRAVGWPATVLVAPGALAAALTRVGADGRTLPAHAACALRYRLARLAARRLAPAVAVVVARGAWFACDHTLAGRVRVHGPGRVLLDAAMALQQQADGVIAAARMHLADPDAGGAPQLVALAEGQVMDVAS